MRVVRTGRRFRMILHAEHRLVPVAESFQRLVVQIDVGDLDFVQSCSESGSTAKPWFCEVISTLPVILFSTG